MFQVLPQISTQVVSLVLPQSTYRWCLRSFLKSTHRQCLSQVLAQINIKTVSQVLPQINIQLVLWWNSSVAEELLRSPVPQVRRLSLALWQPASARRRGSPDTQITAPNILSARKTAGWDSKYTKITYPEFVPEAHKHVNGGSFGAQWLSAPPLSSAFRIGLSNLGTTHHNTHQAGTSLDWTHSPPTWFPPQSSLFYFEKPTNLPSFPLDTPTLLHHVLLAKEPISNQNFTL